MMFGTSVNEVAGALRSNALQNSDDCRSVVGDDQRGVLLEQGATSFQQFVFEHGAAFDSYLATEPGRRCFVSSSASGVISYVQCDRQLLVGGGLISPPESRRDLLTQFLKFVRHHKWTPTFYNISNDTLPLFRENGFQITKWGEEPVVDLKNCDWAGKQFEWVRRQTNYCRPKGLTVREVSEARLSTEAWQRVLEEVREIAVESISRKPRNQEMSFFEGSIADHPLGLRRLFIAESSAGSGRIEAFVVCNPIQGGTKWATELYRRRLDCVRGTVAFLFHEVLQKLRDEGVQQVPLCLDLGRAIDRPVPGDSAVIRHALGFGKKYLGCIFDFAGVQHFKSRFRPRYEERYVCTYPKVTMEAIAAFLRVSGALRLSPVNLLRSIATRAGKRSVRRNLAGGVSRISLREADQV